MRRTLTNIALLGSVATIFFTEPAWAYLDPGTGSMILQAMLGGIVGAMVVGKVYWHRFRAFLTSRLSDKSSESARAKQAGISSRADGTDQ